MTTSLRRVTVSIAFFTASLLSLALPPASHAQASAAYDVSDVDKKPTPKRRIRPEYPESITKKDTPSEITVRFIVKPDGTVSDITIVKFSDPNMIDPVYTAYEEARFTPGEKNGVKVTTRIEVTEVHPQPKKK